MVRAPFLKPYLPALAASVHDFAKADGASIPELPRKADKLGVGRTQQG